jgi:Uma2 family endonuclease
MCDTYPSMRTAMTAVTALAPPRPPALPEPDVLFGREDLFRQLMQIEGKAEIVDGNIVVMSPAHAWHNMVAAEIFVSLRAYARRTKRGWAVTDNAAFKVELPHRQSFSPDAAYYVGPPAKLGPFLGGPVFAVEVRSSGDYGPRAERLMAEKRADYFACGTLVVWDVDLQSPDVVRVYRAAAPEQPTIYRPGDIAEAEPAVPGWTVAVNEILPEDWQATTAV